MTKSRNRYLRLNPILDEQVVKEAKQHEMNFSEFVRYALTLYFDLRLQNADHRLVDPGTEYKES